MKQFKTIRRWILSTIFTLFVLLLFISVVLSNRKSIILESPGNITFLMDNTKTTIGDTEYFCYKNNNSQNTLGTTIMFYTKNANVLVSIDDEIIYSFETDKLFSQSSKSGTLWHITDLPKNHNFTNNDLTIYVNPIYSDKPPKTIKLISGAGAGLIFTMFKAEWQDTILNIILFFLGITLCTIYLIEYKNKISKTATLALGLAAIFTTLWTLCELFTFQMILPTHIGQYYIYHLALYLSILSLTIYTEKTLNIDCSIEIIALAVMSVICTLLQVIGTYAFSQTIMIYMIVMTTVMVSIIVKIKIYRIHLSKQPLVLTSLIMLLIGMLTSFGIYIINERTYTTLLPVKFGFITYILVKTMQSINELIDTLSKAKNSELLIKAAYNDALTGIPNRKAYERDLEDLPLQNIGIVSFDVNNLKYYNDIFGHVKGDQFLIAACDMLKGIYGDALYRTGGDEFVAVLYGMTEDAQAHLRQVLKSAMEKYNSEDHEFILEIAAGDGRYRNGDSSYEDIFKRADKAMYEDKEYLKSISKVKQMR